MANTDGGSPATAPTETPPAVQLTDMFLGPLVTQVVGTIARLGLADQLTAGPRSRDELIRATGADPDGLARLLRAATTVGLIAEYAPDQFALTPLGAPLATNAQPVSLRDYAMLVTDPGHWLPCGRLFDAVMTGRPATTTTLNMGMWDYYQEHPEEGATLARAMGTMATHMSLDVTARYDVARFTRVIDVGGSQGFLLAKLLEAAPQATGVLFDRPELIAKARPVITARGLATRVELVGGDFHSEVPPGGDLYVLKSILHNWDDAHAARILANCHRAARPGSTLLLVESVLPTEPEPSPVYLRDLLMLIQTGGRERTREQYHTLLEAAGYQLAQVIPLRPEAHHPWSLLEAHRL
jgi:SAM-dependent methyltransferase